MGFLASQETEQVTEDSLRKAIVMGSIIASFTVEDFGSQHLLKVDRKRINERYQQFVQLTSFQNNS